MKAFESRARIDAPIERVWEVLTDAEAYARWDNAVLRIEGRIAPGERIKVVPESDPRRAFPVEVGSWDPPRGMVWSGGMPLGLFTGRRTFTLAEDAQGVAFHMREQMTGLLSPLMTRMIPDLQPDFDRFAAGLKAEAEGRSA